jgi:polygalacturonase
MPVTDITLTNVKIDADLGMTIAHVRGMRFVNCRIQVKSGPPTYVYDSQLPGLTGPQTTAFNVRDFGAAGDGVHRDAGAFKQAVAACMKAGGGTVEVPPGVYLTGTILLGSHVALVLDSGATLLASEDPADYPLEPDPWQTDRVTIAPLIDAHDAQDVIIAGRGTIDGQGQIWWQRLDWAEPKKGMPGAITPVQVSEAAKLAHGRPQLIRLVRCRDVLIAGITLRDSPEWNIHPLFCANVRVDEVTIVAPPSSHNTDGIDPESCNGVRIANCRIDTGDDCIALKSGLNEIGRTVGRPDENITITNCVMRHGHGGVTIGSEMSGGVRHVSVANCKFIGTNIGIRIKSQRGRGGVVEDITAANITMEDVPSPFTITMFYTGKDKPTDVYPVGAGTPIFRNFFFSDITADGANSAGSIVGLREMPVENITFRHVRIEASTGISCTCARGIAFQDSSITTAQGPALILDGSSQVDSSGLMGSSGPSRQAPSQQ